MSPTDFERLRAEKGLVLISVHYDGDARTLDITVDSTRVNDEAGAPSTGPAALDAVLADSYDIVVRPGCRRYRVQFDQVIAFQVRDENYVLVDADDDFSTLLRHRKHSAFLDFTRDTTFAEDVLDAAMEHWAVVTLDDVIDIASGPDQPPSVTSRVLTASDLWADDI